MEKIVLLRLEQNTVGGEGMYCIPEGKDLSPAYEVFGGDFPYHKAPHKDKKLRKSAKKVGANLSDYFYAFKHEEQLYKWIPLPEWLVGLHERGIVISEYVCEKSSVLIGSHQCCFKESLSRESFSILDYFNIIA